MLGVLAVVTAGGLAFWAGYSANSRQNEELQAQLKDLTEKEKRSAIERSISLQMEEIAYQQKEISDEQRLEAIEQTNIANEMRRRSEIERQNALEAERNALESERKAVDASHQAENQRLVAEQRREEAEQARSVADSLSYIALARALGNMATTQENAGNHELALLLAYSAYTFINRYGGDVYQRAIYESLSLVTNSNQSWKVHTGPATHMEWIDGNAGRFLTISTYGELLEHRFNNGRLTTKEIFKDKAYDFRDVVVFSNGMKYVISRTGEIFMFKPNDTFVVQPIQGAIHPLSIYPVSDVQLGVIAENGMFFIEQGNLRLDKVIPFEIPISRSGKKNRELFLFGDSDEMLEVDMNTWQVTKKRLPFPEKVFSYTISQYGTDIFGTTDGVLIEIDNQGKMTRLVGHRSRASRVTPLSRMAEMLNDRQILVSSSYDGTVKLWDLDNEKPEGVNVFSSNDWVLFSEVDNSGDYLWTGDQKGNLTRSLISVSTLAQVAKNMLTRDFTKEEWDYYIGSNIPFESFKGR